MNAIKLIAVILICAIILVGCGEIKYDNFTDKDELITKQYSEEQIEALQTAMIRGGVTFSRFKKDFKAECVRKTCQGYYVVLSLEEGGNAFVFLNQNGKVVDVVVKKDFWTKSEFLAQDVAHMTMSEVLLYDPEAILLPMSRVSMTAHIVQEGAFVIKYIRYVDGVYLDDSAVGSIEFYENDDVLSWGAVPYILEIDRK